MQRCKKNTITLLTSGSLKNSNISFNLDNSTDNQQIYTFGEIIPNIWIAVGSGTNTIAYSYDGINWYGLGAYIFTSSGNDVYWNGTIWIAVGTSSISSIAYSYDGITWINTGTNNFFITQCNRMTTNGSIITAVGSGGINTIIYSTDGIKWTSVSGSTSIFSTQGTAIATNGTNWVAVGSGSNTIATSNNGIVWSGIGSTILSTAGLC